MQYLNGSNLRTELPSVALEIRPITERARLKSSSPSAGASARQRPWRLSRALTWPWPHGSADRTHQLPSPVFILAD